MNTLRQLMDKFAISLSLLCALHCLLLPLVLVWLPVSSLSMLNSEAFHLALVVLVIPLSLCALLMGCWKHKRYSVLVLGSVGLLFLITALLFEHDSLGELGEKILTFAGAAFIGLGHWCNYKLCQHDESCDCSREFD